MEEILNAIDNQNVSDVLYFLLPRPEGAGKFTANDVNTITGVPLLNHALISPSHLVFPNKFKLGIITVTSLCTSSSGILAAFKASSVSYISPVFCP